MNMCESRLCCVFIERVVSVCVNLAIVAANTWLQALNTGTEYACHSAQLLSSPSLPSIGISLVVPMDAGRGVCECDHMNKFKLLLLLIHIFHLFQIKTNIVQHMICRSRIRRS